MTSGGEIVQMPPAANTGGTGYDGGGSDLRERLARVEERTSSIKDAMATKTNISDMNVNLAKVEGKVSSMKQTMATKADVSNLKVWILAGALTITVVAVGATATVIIKILLP